MVNNEDVIILKGLTENNLKNIHIKIPKNKIVVFTGLSGSGKSSLVFNTIAMESRRQMTMNYPQYVRNQMPRYEKPKAKLMKNLSPVVVIDQKPISKNIQSTVGTYMDIDPLIRLLFSRIGSPSLESASHFSNHTSFGQCPSCKGYGQVIAPDVEKLVDKNRSLREYAVRFKPLSPSTWQGRWMMTGGLFDPDKRIKDYTEQERTLFLYGPPKREKVFAPFHTKHGPQDHEWDGLLPRFTRLYIHRDISTLKQTNLEEVLAVTSQAACSTCHGTGLHPRVLSCKINGFHIGHYNDFAISELLQQLRNINDPLGASLASQIIPRLHQLMDVGLNYLCLSRKMNEMSGGESQRVKIARHLGSSLNNLIYIFDEPTAGLHPKEVSLLASMIRKLKEAHNTVFIIEHDSSMIDLADEIVQMGPGAGVDGGKVVYQGPLKPFKEMQAETGYLQKVRLNEQPRDRKEFFHIKNATANNLKNLSIKIPKQCLVSVCGVSGSGKSTLLGEVFYEKFPETIYVGQTGIGTSRRSTLATYMGIMDDLRRIFAKKSGNPMGLFSFNSLGACPVCKGKGFINPDVAFADPVTVRCEACNGTRYSQDALSHLYKGKNIVDILQLTIAEVLQFFEHEGIVQRAQKLNDVGLGYMTLGQTTSTFSGGEIQRLKLASHLQKDGQIYIIDEPSLGLHIKDFKKLLAVLQHLVSNGNSVIIIEHNVHMIAASDWIIELGPGAGKDGGSILFEGTPKDMIEADTVTAEELKRKTE